MGVLVKELIYGVGWLLHAAGQCNAALSSKQNGLSGAAGVWTWIKGHLVNLLTRAFFSILAYGLIVHTFAEKMKSAGFNIGSFAVAGLAGYACNAVLHQLFVMVPWLHIEDSDLAPPATATVPVAVPAAFHETSGDRGFPTPGNAQGQGGKQ